MIKILGITCAGLLVLLAVAGWQIKGLFQENGKLELAVEFQVAETLKQVTLTTQFRLDVAREQAALGILLDERRKDGIRYERDLVRIAEQRKSSARAAAKFPDRFGAIATFGLRRGMREACRASGGTKQACAIEAVRSRKAKPGNSGEPDRDGVKRSSDAAVEPRNPGRQSRVLQPTRYGRERSPHLEGVDEVRNAQFQGMVAVRGVLGNIRRTYRKGNAVRG